MKAIPTTPSVLKTDASLDVKLNPVQVGTEEIVSWGAAFPRPSLPRTAARQTAASLGD